ncbi:MAG TPA: chemotaxis protein CheB [Chitinophagaceae bacterium]
MNTNSQPTYVVVVGASAGGLNALSEFVGQLTTDMDIAVFTVLHLSTTGIGDYLVQKLQSNTSLKCIKATDNRKIEKGFIYIAPPNHHLLVKKQRMILGRGPVENRWRPSIDVLFRSAAVAFGTRAIGILLTGLLDDGKAGMLAIKKCGGVCVVQDPNEAEYPDMPLAVLDAMEVNYCVSLAEMGSAIKEIMKQPLQEDVGIPEEIKAESEIAEKVAIGVERVEDLGGEHSIYSCPDCGGSLWQITENNMHRYRCYIGHAYSENDLLTKQAENMEATLWVALRMMEERRTLLHKMEQDAKRKGFIRIASDHHNKGIDLQMHIDKLKDILFSTQNNNRETAAM